MTSKDELLAQCYHNEEIYWDYPQYGGVANWFLLYWELHNKVLDHLGEDQYQLPLTYYHGQIAVRKASDSNDENRPVDDAG